MASDPKIREQVLDALPPGEWVEAESMTQLRSKLKINCSRRALRRAISSLYYGHKDVDLQRPFHEEGQGRAWAVCRLESASR